MASLVKSKHIQQHQKQRKYKPMLCSLSNHDQLNQPLSPRRHSTSSSSSTSTSSSSEDPSSPRVGCMGQVKIKNHNLVGSQAPINSYDHSMVKYLNFRLKGFFSNTSLINYPTSAIRAAVAGAHKDKTRRVRNIHININKESHIGPYYHPRPRNSTGSRIVLCRCNIDNNNTSNNQMGYCVVNLKEMDPPLPVMKRVLNHQQQEEKEMLSLWKRRSGGVPLKRVQICQVMTQQKHQFLVPAETV